jgi:hypothetical protein
MNKLDASGKTTGGFSNGIFGFSPIGIVDH